jgi:tryptophanyl-tRNA synthetase
MSGSNPVHTGVVDLTDTPKQAAKKIKSAVTDSETEIRFDPKAKPGVSNLLTIYSVLTNRTVDDIVAEYAGKQYGHLKVDLAEIVGQLVGDFGERTRELLDDKGELDRILAAGAARAREVATPTLELVYERSGFTKPAGGRS